MFKKLIFVLLVLGVAYFAFQKGVFNDSLEELNGKKENVAQEYNRLQADLQEIKDTAQDTQEKVEKATEAVKAVVETVEEGQEKLEGLGR